MKTNEPRDWLQVTAQSTNTTTTRQSRSVKILISYRRGGASMVFHGRYVVAVATISADLCQYVACNPQRLRSHEVLDLICCLPLRQLGRLVVCICSFFCLPPTSPRYFRYYRRPFQSSSSSSSDDSDYESHSD